jgi:hypothetical protein
VSAFIDYKKQNIGHHTDVERFRNSTAKYSYYKFPRGMNILPFQISFNSKHVILFYLSAIVSFLKNCTL